MNTQYSFAVNHTEAAQLIKSSGHRVTYILESEPGIGKSSLLKTLKTELGEDYEYVYVDVPLKDIPDVALTMPNHETKTTQAYTNSIWIGTDPKKPKVIMLDEVFKGGEYVRLMMNRLMLERKVGDYELPEGSIVFGTTNFQSDAVGDRTSSHTNSRVARIPMRKPNQKEWEIWAINNNIHETVLTWVNQNPMVFNSYKDTEFNKDLHNDGNGVFQYIFHPQHNNSSYVCPRTLELASNQLHDLKQAPSSLIQSALIGSLGMKAALDINAMIELGADLPNPADIESSPTTAKIPESGIAKMMMIYKSIQHLTDKNIDSYAVYFKRMPIEIFSTWAKTAVNNSKIRLALINNKQVTDLIKNDTWII